MAKISKKHREEMGQYLGKGVHKVKIMLVEFGTTEKGQEYVEFTVADEQGREGTSRMWFTTDPAIQYTFNTIRTIFVHNTPEDKRDKIRAAFDEIKDTKQLEKVCEKLIGKEAWYSVQEDPDRTYPGKDGKVRNSWNRNIYGFEPKIKEVESTPDSVKPDKDSDKSEDKDEPFADF